jgi:hypothetical protein
VPLPFTNNLFSQITLYRTRAGIFCSSLLSQTKHQILQPLLVLLMFSRYFKSSVYVIPNSAMELPFKNFFMWTHARDGLEKTVRMAEQCHLYIRKDLVEQFYKSFTVSGSPVLHSGVWESITSKPHKSGSCMPFWPFRMDQWSRSTSIKHGL